MDVQGAQIAAIVIFIGMFGLIISEKVERHIVTLSAALLTLLVVFSLLMQDMGAVMKALNVQSIVQTPFWFAAESGGETSTGINWETIFFIAGMMVMVEGMADSGFFRWLCMALARMVRYKPIPLFLTFMVIAALLSMFIDSITVIMFLAAVTMELARTLKFDPVPMILSEIFCANLGGSATMCGDPPNIIIGTSLGYSFGDFLGNTGVIALASLAVVILYLYLCFRKQLVCAAPSDPREYPSPRSAITNKHGFIVSWFIFIGAVLLLATHAQTGLTVSYIGVLIAAATLITSGKRVYRQHSLCRDHDPRHPQHRGNAGRAAGDADLGAGRRHGHRRQRNAHRRIGQRGGHVHRQQGRTPDLLGALLQGDGPADADCDGHRAADHQAALFWLTQRRNFVIE